MEAVKQAAAGQTVWIKSGLYDDPPDLSVANSGTLKAPIKFVGYKTKPGDITSMYFKYAPGVQADPAQMPLIRGKLSSQGTAFSISSKSNIGVRNLQFSRHYYNLLWVGNSSNIVADNIVSTHAEGSLSFHGLSVTKGRIVNSVAINSSMGNVRYYGTFGLIDNVKSYGDLQTSTQQTTTSR